MLLIVSSDARLKPEIRLAEAVSQFEASLPDDQKLAFRDQRARSLKSPPDTNDVMRLTAQIDQLQRPGGRCFGPRFTKFLHGAQQFAALGDVIVGGSQNIVACGIWSLVRMTLLVTVNYSAYIESLSLLLMEAGRLTPQHFELAVLYPRSKELQSHITEYFIVVVHLCHCFQAYVLKSAFRRLTSSLNDENLREIQSKLSFWSKSIREEMDLLVARRTEEEAKHNSRFRALMSKASREASRQQRISANQKILDACSMYDYETTWRQIRKTGNTTLYKKAPGYNEWKRKSGSSTLFLNGKLGSGKSVMLANIIDDLIIPKESHDSGDTIREPDAAIVSYFFCKHDLPESLKARTVIGALVRQIIRPFLDSFNGAESHERPLDYDQLIEMLRHFRPNRDKIYVILDGLDLCDCSEAKVIATQLQAMLSKIPILLCISHRLEPDTRSRLDLISTDFPSATTASLPDNTSDIEAFIEAELERTLATRSLVLGDPVLVLEIQDALSKGSQGMFLWVVLQIQSLCAMRTDEEIRDALSNLPRDLFHLYRQIAKQSKRPGRCYQRQIFELVFFAKRPLTVDEIREALSVTPGDTVWTASKLLNDVWPVLATCGCLITVDEEENTIRLIHPSVRTFICNAYQDLRTSTLMMSTIVTYLSYGVFGTEVSLRLPTLEAGSAPSRIIESTASTSRGVQSIALRLLRSRKQPKFDAAKVIAECRRSNRPFKVNDFHFYRYARVYALQHALDLPEQEPDTLKTLFSLLRRNLIFVGTQRESFELVKLAMQFGSDETTEYLMPWVTNTDPGRLAGYDPSLSYADLFNRAIVNGRLNAMRLFLEFAQRGYKEWERKETVQSHPVRREEPRLRLSPSEPEPLHLAIEKHQNHIVKLMIQYGFFNLKRKHVKYFPQTLVEVAIKKRNLVALRLLLSSSGLGTLEDMESLISRAKALDESKMVLVLETYRDRNPESPRDAEKNCAAEHLYRKRDPWPPVSNSHTR